MYGHAGIGYTLLYVLRTVKSTVQVRGLICNSQAIHQLDVLGPVRFHGW